MTGNLYNTTRLSVTRTIVIVLMALCGTAAWADDRVEATTQNTDSVKQLEKWEVVFNWVGEHLDSLADSYLAKSGNILDPDIVREELKTIGYNGLNVTDYIWGSRQIDSLVLIRLLDRAEAENNKTIFFMMGSTGAGKSTALRNNPDLKAMVNSVGLVYDGAFISIPSFETRLKMVQDRGFKASIIFVHNDPETGFTNTIKRMIQNNRSMSLYYYAYCYPRFHKRIEYLLREHPDVDLYCLDNSHNKGGVRVSTEEALTWDYTITKRLMSKLYKIKNRFVKSGLLTPEQIEALNAKK